MFSYAASTFVQSPTLFALNPDHAGKWLGEIFGGGTHSSIQTETIWKEIVPYGETPQKQFAWISPRLDQMLYDLVMETDAGLLKMSTKASDNVMRVFNNDDPRRGPVGTCVAFDRVATFNYFSTGHRIFGRVAGGEIIVRPGGYSNIGYSNNPILADNISGGGECLPNNLTPNPGNKSNAVGVFAQIIQDPHFLDSPSWLHPLSLGSLMGWATVFQLPVDYRTAAVPRDLTDDPLKYREVIESLMRSIPADLVLRLDPADGRKKYFAVARQQPGQTGYWKITSADLSNASFPARVTMDDDPDGYYANEISFRTEDYYVAPITTLSDPSQNKLVLKNHWQSNVVDIFEQSSSRTGQVISGEEKLKFWRYEDTAAFRQWVIVLETTRSQTQRVITAEHGWRSMRFSLGHILEYRIDGVYRGPGQIRGMRFNLDSQTVTVKTYHLPVEGRVVDVSTTIRDKQRAVSHKDTPHIDRREG